MERQLAGTRFSHIWVTGLVMMAAVLTGIEPAEAGDGPTESAPYTVAVVSDLNGSYGSTRYAENVHATVDWLTGDLAPDLVVSTGDHVAGQKRGLDYAAMWDAFHRAVTERLAEAGIPFAPTPGNHDASAAPQFDRERNRYLREWRERRPDVQFVDDAHYPLRYAYRAGPALFVSMDATMPGRLSDEQFDWLREVLNRGGAAGTNRDVAESATYKIVYGHLPLVPFAETKRDEAIKSERLETLFRETGVDVVLSGHHHAYYPGRRGDLRLVGLGCLGAGPRRLIGAEERSRKSAVVMTLHADGTVDIEGRAGPAMQERIKRETLPRSIGTGRWAVRRDDLRPLQKQLSSKAAEQLSKLRTNPGQ